MKTNLTKFIVGILIAGALLIVGAGLGYLSTNYELVSKKDVKEETNIDTIEEEKKEEEEIEEEEIEEEEEPQAEPAEQAEFNVDEDNDNTTYTNQTVQQPIQTTLLTIDDVIVLDTDLYDGTLEVAYTVTNNTDKYINRIDFHIYCVDTNGNRLTDTFVQVNVDLAPNTSNDILSEGISFPTTNNYSHVVIEATDFRF